MGTGAGRLSTGGPRNVGATKLDYHLKISEVPKSVFRVFSHDAEASKACCALQNIDGDGRWKIEWYGVPCNVGDTKLDYHFKVKQYYWFELVISNTRIPIVGVSVHINGKWMDLARSVTNTWPYHRVSPSSHYMQHSVRRKL